MTQLARESVVHDYQSSRTAVSKSRFRSVVISDSQEVPLASECVPGARTPKRESLTAL